MGPFNSIDQIVSANQLHQNGHWFSEGAKRFFGCRVHEQVYKGTFFITTERYNFESKRFYTVRCAFSDGSIETMGDFQGFSTKYQAEKFIESLPSQLGDALKTLIESWNNKDSKHFTKHLIDPGIEDTFCGACQWLVENIKQVQSGWLIDHLELKTG